MAVRDWHPGQLAIVWVLALASVPFGYALGVVFGGFLSLPILGDALMLLTPVCAFAWMLRVSWVWFGSRRA